MDSPNEVRERISHLFFCLGALVVGAKNGMCQHGKPLASWQTPISSTSAWKLVAGLAVLGTFAFATVVAILLSNVN